MPTGVFYKHLFLLNFLSIQAKKEKKMQSFSNKNSKSQQLEPRFEPHQQHGNITSYHVKQSEQKWKKRCELSCLEWNS
jgi:hypothetical protein